MSLATRRWQQVAKSSIRCGNPRKHAISGFETVSSVQSRKIKSRRRANCAGSSVQAISRVRFIFVSVCLFSRRAGAQHSSLCGKVVLCIGGRYGRRDAGHRSPRRVYLTMTELQLSLVVP